MQRLHLPGKQPQDFASLKNQVITSSRGGYGTELSDSQTLAPVFDCGSSLCPQADEEIMTSILSDKNEPNYRIYETPSSALQINGKRIKYYNFITLLENEDCNAALKRIISKTDLDSMYNMINDIPCIGELQKHFCKTLISERKAKILDTAYNLLQK